MKKILVPLDGSASSKRGLRKAIEIAKNDKSIIIGLHITIAPTYHAISTSKVQKFPKNVTAVLKKAEIQCAKNDIPFKGKILVGGDPAYDIVKFSQKTHPNMIVMGARGQSTLKRIFIGSVSDYVLQKSKIPVMVVK